MRSSLRHRRAGFTLLELILASAILALFILPMLQVLHEARVRAVKYTKERTLRDLAQRKLFERIYAIELADVGTFEAEGHPQWTWEVYPPEVVSQGSQPLLQYTIAVSDGSGSPEGEALTGAAGTGAGALEMSVWTFPSREWLDQQAELEAMGYMTPLSGSPLSGGAPLGF